jgi:hypothetical protein
LSLAQGNPRYRVFDGTKSPVELVAQAHEALTEISPR